MRGLLYYTVFKKVLRHFSGNSPCIYYLEMQAWEKALNAAGRHYPDAQMIGFQHSSFSKNHFSYFYAKDDLQQRGALTDLPLPGVLGCNGPIFERHFEEQGYPNVQQLEAVRNFYLRHVLNGSRPVKATPPVVLFAGTFSPQETKALFLMLRVACPKPDRFQVWIKTHPGTVGREQALGIDFNNSLYQIKQNPMSELLAEAKTVVAVSNSVALEALAFGCQVILPVFANALFMDPLANRQELFQKVYNPQQLIRAIDYTLQREVTDDELQQARNLVQSYWNIDESLPGWSRILLDRVARQPRPVGVGL